MNLLAKTIYKEVAVYFVLLIAMLLTGNAVDLTFQLLRSEEHTSELQSLVNLVCRLLLEKKNKQKEKKV